MQSRRWLATFILLLALVIAACAPSGSASPVDLNTVTPAPTGTAALSTPEVTPSQPAAATEEAAPTAEELAETPEAAPATDSAATLSPLVPVIVGTVESPGDPIGVDQLPPELLEDIIADLQKRTGSAREAVRISLAEVVLWNDGSLGCPQPGMFYTQALVEGYRVILVIEGTSYDYRAAGKGYFFLCEQKAPPSIRATAVPLQPVPLFPTAAP